MLSTTRSIMLHSAHVRFYSINNPGGLGHNMVKNASNAFKTESAGGKTASLSGHRYGHRPRHLLLGALGIWAYVSVCLVGGPTDRAPSVTRSMMSSGDARDREGGPECKVDKVHGLEEEPPFKPQVLVKGDLEKPHGIKPDGSYGGLALKAREHEENSAKRSDMRREQRAESEEDQ